MRSEAALVTPSATKHFVHSLLARKHAEFTHLAPRYELNCFIATMGRIGHLRRLVARWALGTAPGPAVELCCGTGGVTVELARRFEAVLGVDFCSPMLARAGRRLARARLPGVTLLQRDVCRLELAPASQSAVVISLGLHEMSAPMRDGLLERARTWLRPGGRLVLCDYVRPPGRLRAALFRWFGRLFVDRELFVEFIDYPLADRLRQLGLTLVARRRLFLSCVEVSAWRPSL